MPAGSVPVPEWSEVVPALGWPEFWQAVASVLLIALVTWLRVMRRRAERDRDFGKKRRRHR